MVQPKRVENDSAKDFSGELLSLSLHARHQADWLRRIRPLTPLVFITNRRFPTGIAVVRKLEWRDSAAQFK